jgi:hypothetical protein
MKTYVTSANPAYEVRWRNAPDPITLAIFDGKRELAALEINEDQALDLARALEEAVKDFKET